MCRRTFSPDSFLALVQPKYPRWFSDDVVDLLKGLLNKNQDDRLGGGDNDAEDIRNHPWFADINWDDVLAKKLNPPIVPSVDFDSDTVNFDEYFTTQPAVDSPAAPPTANDLFRGMVSLDVLWRTKNLAACVV